MLLLLLLFLATGAEAQDAGCYSSGSVAGIVIATVVVTLTMGGLASASLWYLWRQGKGASEDVPEVEKCKYAFDNAYFKEEEKALNSAEKGESGFLLGNGTQQNTQPPSNGEQKRCALSFHPSSKKQKTTTDDTSIPKAESVTVPLRGVDFTGLGFNICGNMREGIFVRDVLHRGPASESGNIKAGDRLLGMSVSFSGMVYEDAVTILSYASPYDVRLEVEKSFTPPKYSSSTGRRGLLHPLYRSQSIDDLLSHNSSSHSPGLQKSIKESFAVPKRSQSVETSSSIPKSPAKNSDDVSSTSSTHSSSPNTATVPPNEDIQKEVNNSRFRVEKIRSAVLTNPHEEKETTDCILTTDETPPKLLDGQVEAPTAPPRTPKRRAPPPPDHKEIEVRAEENEPPALPDFVPMERSELESSNTSSAASVAHHPSESESPGKRKASSLGDLTRLGAKHKASVSSAILERAVSLDLQQSIPGENLVKQKKVLKAPSFDSDCDENREDIEVAGLKRWEDQFLGLENGEDELAVDGTSSKRITQDADGETLQDSETLETVIDVTKGEAEEVLSPKENVNGEVSSAPMTISIPVIKPDLTHFEKLPSPPPVLDWRLSKSSDEASKAELERISVQSLYKPIFSSKEVPAAADESLVNGVKTPNNAAGFAKTLIVSGPDEVEEMLGLAPDQ